MDAVKSSEVALTMEDLKVHKGLRSPASPRQGAMWKVVQLLCNMDHMVEFDGKQLKSTPKKEAAKVELKANPVEPDGLVPRCSWCPAPASQPI